MGYLLPVLEQSARVAVAPQSPRRSSAVPSGARRFPAASPPRSLPRVRTSACAGSTRRGGRPSCARGTAGPAISALRRPSATSCEHLHFAWGEVSGVLQRRRAGTRGHPGAQLPQSPRQRSLLAGGRPARGSCLSARLSASSSPESTSARAVSYGQPDRCPEGGCLVPVIPALSRVPGRRPSDATCGARPPARIGGARASEREDSFRLLVRRRRAALQARPPRPWRSRPRRFVAPRPWARRAPAPRRAARPAPGSPRRR